MKDNKKIKLFEAFAGIGSQYKALKNISTKKKWDIEVVGIIEWYIDAIIAYMAIHHNIISSKPEETNIKYVSKNSKDIVSKNQWNKIKKSQEAFFINKSKEIAKNLFDITKVTYIQMPKNIDIFTYSFPCQDISLQGKQKGILKSTRSGLLFEIERILFEMKENFKNIEMPKYLLLENVNNILSKNHKESYGKWINSLKELGYESETYTLNSSDFGSPQNRKRTFCISVRIDIKKKVSFDFPIFEEMNNKKNIKSILEKNIDEKYFLNKLLDYDRSSETKSKNGLIKTVLQGYTTFNSETYVYNEKGQGPTLTASGANSRIKIFNKDRIRQLSPLETYKYMGFLKDDFNKVKNTNLLNDNRIIYTAGNSISIEVLEAIFSSMKF